jgi:protein-export membrane protein SecD
VSRRRAVVTLLVILAVAWGSLAAMLLSGMRPKLGLDLQGGFAVTLVAPEGTDEDTLETAAEIMRRRIENLGSIQEPEIAVQGSRAIQVQLPGVEERARALEAVGTTGEMSFRPVLAVFPTSPAIDDPDGSTLIVYHVGPAFLTGSDMVGGEDRFSGTGGHGAAGGWVVVPEFTGEGGEKFRAATGELAGFAFGDPRRQLAIVVDGVVTSAPQVAEDVNPAQGLDPNQVVITIGNPENPEAEAQDLASILRYGALPTTFERERVESVSATLGDDSLRAGLIAGLLGLALVGIYMLVYYRALGLIAIVGLSVFGSLLIGVIILLGELQGTTLTLAGVAGIIVSIGITLDSYIVYFERIKEEYGHGRGLRAAADHAFRGAFRTVLTGDTVTFLGAILLWFLAIGSVKGFALTLGIATVIDVVVSYFYTRPSTWLLVRSALGDGGGAFGVKRAMGGGRHATEISDIDERVEVHT